MEVVCSTESETLEVLCTNTGDEQGNQSWLSILFCTLLQRDELVAIWPKERVLQVLYELHSRVNVLAADIQGIQLQDVDPWKFYVVTGVLQPNADRGKGANDLEELADSIKIAAREVHVPHGIHLTMKFSICSGHAELRRKGIDGQRVLEGKAMTLVQAMNDVGCEDALQICEDTLKLLTNQGSWTFYNRIPIPDSDLVVPTYLKAPDPDPTPGNPSRSDGYMAPVAWPNTASGRARPRPSTIALPPRGTRAWYLYLSFLVSAGPTAPRCVGNFWHSQFRIPTEETAFVGFVHQRLRETDVLALSFVVVSQFTWLVRRHYGDLKLNWAIMMALFLWNCFVIVYASRCVDEYVRLRFWFCAISQVSHTLALAKVPLESSGGVRDAWDLTLNHLLQAIFFFVGMRGLAKWQVIPILLRMAAGAWVSYYDKRGWCGCIMDIIIGWVALRFVLAVEYVMRCEFAAVGARRPFP
eukprot:jgi/Botrbrau1/16441/Bobra.0142s0037.1